MAAAQSRTASPAQMALGQALTTTAAGCGDRGVREGGGAGAEHATGADSPQAQIAEVALAEGRQGARRSKALDTLTGYDHTDVASARKLATLLDPKQGRRRGCRRRCSASVAVDPFDAGVAHARSAAWRSTAATRAEAVRLFRVALAAGPLDGPARTPISPKALLEAGQQGRGEASRRCAALEIAPTYTRAQDLLLKLTGGQQ